ncbi:hypothetical protein BGZ51_009459 [Haplosporangium sp. Z 767]|nr:hypothetical protein BGZ51_009459 [Haplosporangium sp. Z 767]
MIFGKKTLALLALFGLATSSHTAPTSLTTLDDITDSRVAEIVPILIPHDIVVAAKFKMVTTHTDRYSSWATTMEASVMYDGWQDYYHKDPHHGPVGKQPVIYSKKTCLDNDQYCVQIKIHSKTCDIFFWIRNQAFSYVGASKDGDGNTFTCGMTWAAKH